MNGDGSKKGPAAECPMCFESFSASVIHIHASRCSGKKRPSPTLTSPSADKKRRLDVGGHLAESMRSPKSPSKKVERQPLADAMRPSTFDEVIGQDDLLKSNSLWKSLLTGAPASMPSLIFWGPPGSGKTSLAHVIATACKADTSKKARFVKMSACTSGVSDVKDVVNVSKNEWRMFKRRTILFVDEVHRFNKIQQDSFLPHIEDGTIILLGATTENPSFSLNNALLSRCRVLTLKRLEPDAVKSILTRAIDKTNSDIKVDDEALDFLANVSDGDARSALNSLESALTWASASGKKTLASSDVVDSLNKGHTIKYDRKGDEHYHCASALQKSIRGSNPDAALYWTMRMYEGGEDPMFIARRFVRIASEDIGLADPNALPFAVSAMQGCQMIGRPENNVILAHCAIYLAKAPKSHVVMHAMDKVTENLKANSYMPPVPIHLRNSRTKLDREAGYGIGYSHDLAKVDKISYMPTGMENVHFL